MKFNAEIKTIEICGLAVSRRLQGSQEATFEKRV